MEERRCRRMEINRFNVVLEKFQQFCFDLKVFKKVIPDRSNCVAGAFQTRQLTDSADFTVEWLTRSYISLRGRRKEGGGRGTEAGRGRKPSLPNTPFFFFSSLTPFDACTQLKEVRYTYWMIHMVPSFCFASTDKCDSCSNYQLNYLPKRAEILTYV